MDDLISGFYRSTKVTIDTLGDVELKYVSFGDMIAFEKLMQESISDRDFTGKVLFNQIVTPAVEFDSVQNLPDEQLEKLARAFIDFEHHNFELLENTGDFYKDFKRALVAKREQENAELRKVVEPILKETQKQLASFSRAYASVIAQTAYQASYIRDALSSVTEIVMKVKDDQIRFISSLMPTIDQLSYTAEVVTKALQPQIGFWNKWVEQNSKLYDNFSRFWTGFQRQYAITELEATKVLKRYKWFITPSFPLGFVYQVVQLGQHKGRQDKAINNLFISYFEEDNWHNLDLMVKRWKTNPLLKKRFKILSDCVETLKQTGYTRINSSAVILPTLIAQIDGALSDYMEINNISWKRYAERNIKVRQNKPRILTQKLDEQATDVFLNILFQQSQTGVPLNTPFNFNRHKILHGEKLRYGRKDYLIRAFMVLDFLSYF